MARPEWLFDDSPIDDPMGYGQRAVDFLRQLKHPKSRLPGRQWQLDPWVERLVRRIYGPVDEDGQRQVRTVFAMVPRGARKTTVGAALVCLHTFGPERVPNGQVVSAAADAKQANIAYDEALGIVQAMPEVAAKLQVRVGTHKIRHPKKGATYESISSDGATQHGRTVNFLLSDEIHAWKKRDLWEALKTSLAKTPESLHVITTTAGRGQDNLAFDLVSYARKVASGEVDDPTFLPVLFEPDAGADWKDEALWHEVNPGLALGYPDIKGLRAMAREAENRPADQDAFRQYHLNFWPDHSTSPFVDMATYDEGSDPIDMDALAGKECWLAADLSSSGDLMRLCPAGQDPSLAIRKTAVAGRTETWTEGEAVRLVKAAWRSGYRGLACIVAIAWDTSFSPVDVRTLTPDHAVQIGDDWAFAIRRGKTNEAAYGILSRRTRRIVETYLADLDFDLHDHAPIFRTKGYVPTEKGGRPRHGAPYQKNSLAEDFRVIRTMLFGKEEKRRLMDMRRTGAVEANAGGASVESIAAKMGNSIDQNKTLQKTYMPVNTAAVRAAEDARRIGRKKLTSEQNEVKKLKLVQGKS